MARIDPAVVHRMVSTLVDALDSLGAGGGTLRIVQLGEDEPEDVSYWARFVGYELVPRRRSRYRSNEPDIADLSVSIGVYVTEGQPAAAAISSVAATVGFALDEQTVYDSEEATEDNKHRVDLYRTSYVITEDPQPNRALRAGIVSVVGTVFRKAGTSVQQYVE